MLQNMYYDVCTVQPKIRGFRNISLQYAWTHMFWCRSALFNSLSISLFEVSLHFSVWSCTLFYVIIWHISCDIYHVYDHIEKIAYTSCIYTSWSILYTSWSCKLIKFIYKSNTLKLHSCILMLILCLHPIFQYILLQIWDYYHY